MRWSIKVLPNFQHSEFLLKVCLKKSKVITKKKIFLAAWKKNAPLPIETHNLIKNFQTVCRIFFHFFCSLIFRWISVSWRQRCRITSRRVQKMFHKLHNWTKIPEKITWLNGHLRVKLCTQNTVWVALRRWSNYRWYSNSRNSLLIKILISLSNGRIANDVRLKNSYCQNK